MIGLSSVKRGGVWFSIAVNQDGRLVACSFSDRNRREAEKAVRNALPEKVETAVTTGRRDSRSFRALYELFEGGGGQAFSHMIDLSLVSNFRKKVYDLLCEIPTGRVTTYGEIAKRLGGKRYARAVGTAVATNPLPLIVPCHRVVPVSLEIGNYGMGGRKPSTGAYMKRRLLEREGVKFQGRRVSEKSKWIPN